MPPPADRSLRLPPRSRPGAARPARPAAGDARPRRLRGGLRGDRPPLRQATDPLRGRDRRLDASEDVTQDAFSKALLALRRDDAEIDLRPWLYRIVRNTALNDLRDSRPSPRDHSRRAIDGRRAAAAEALERREELAELIERLQALPERTARGDRDARARGPEPRGDRAPRSASRGAARQADLPRPRGAARRGSGCWCRCRCCRRCCSEAPAPPKRRPAAARRRGRRGAKADRRGAGGAARRLAPGDQHRRSPSIMPAAPGAVRRRQRSRPLGGVQRPSDTRAIAGDRPPHRRASMEDADRRELRYRLERQPRQRRRRRSRAAWNRARQAASGERRR